MTSFWKDLRYLSSRRNAVAECVDDAVTKETITALWQRKFASVLNSVSDDAAKDEFITRVANGRDIIVRAVTVRDLSELVKRLPDNKAIGLDDIPTEFYKYAPLNILVRISILFNNFMTLFFT